MANPVQMAAARGWRWQRPFAFPEAMPRVLVWTLVVALLWALIRPPLTLLAGMSRWQPPGGEMNYWFGLGAGIVVDIAVYGFLAVFFLKRRERWAQGLLIAASFIQCAFWLAQLAQSPHGYAPVPANYPVTPALVPRDVMYAASALFTGATGVLAAMPAAWRWTRRDDKGERAAA